jgi:hydroxymethylbilane synthase
MAEASSSRLRLGTRGSKLARWQAEWVTERLRHAGHAVEIIEITTRGDTEETAPIGSIGTGVFTKEIQRAVLAGQVDIAVHSLKDLPTDEVAGLILAAVPRRESPADVLVSHSAASLGALPKNAHIGTGSLRRQAQLRYARPDLHVEPIRGNVDTRLRRLDEGACDAIVLAEAGLKRLGLAGRITEVLSYEAMLPAVGQGALGVECRGEDWATRAALAPLDDRDSRAAVVAERSLLAHLSGGCLAPIGALGICRNGMLHLSAVVLCADGSRRLEASHSASPEEAVALGQQVAETLLAQGAADLIAGSRG